MNTEADEYVREADLQGHLTSHKNAAAKETKDVKDPKNKEKVSGKTTADAAPAPKLVNTDYQLNEALNLLKGLNIMSLSKS